MVRRAHHVMHNAQCSIRNLSSAIRNLQSAIRNLQSESGQYLVWFLILLPLIMALVGLVVDGGFMYSTFRRAQIAVDTAAQAAAHEVDAAHFAATNEVRLSPEAMAVAQEYASINSRNQVYLTSLTVNGDRVQAAGVAVLPTLFMRMVGVEQMRVHVVGYARPAFGLNVEGQ
jgi:Flp pilus assembly protein TadG